MPEAAHNGHTPEIAVNGDEATGPWHLNDVLINLDEADPAERQRDLGSLRHGWKASGASLRTGYKRLLEMIGPLDPQSLITSQPIN